MVIRCKAAGFQTKYMSALAMKEHFCPHDNYWRDLVLLKSRQLVQQAMDGLQHGQK